MTEKKETDGGSKKCPELKEMCANWNEPFTKPISNEPESHQVSNNSTKDLKIKQCSQNPQFGTIIWNPESDNQTIN